MSNYDLLKQKIQDKIPKLLEMSKGQLFAIKNMPFHYEFLHFIYNDDDDIVEIATLYNGEIDVFDYDYFKNQQITIFGKDPMLNDVLLWHSSSGINKYSHFEVSKGEAYFSIYEGEESESIIWDLSKPYLKDQSYELIEWLSTLG